MPTDKSAYFILTTNDIDLILLRLYETSEVLPSTLISLFEEKAAEN
jgi:hypothetical protein